MPGGGNNNKSGRNQYSGRGGSVAVTRTGSKSGVAVAKPKGATPKKAAPGSAAAAHQRTTGLIYSKAKSGSSSTHVPVLGGGTIHKTNAAAVMHGTGSAQHKTAEQRFGKGDAPVHKVGRMTVEQHAARRQALPMPGGKPAVGSTKGNKVPVQGLRSNLSVHESSRKDYSGKPIRELHHAEHGHIADIRSVESKIPQGVKGNVAYGGFKTVKGHSGEMTPSAARKVGLTPTSGPTRTGNRPSIRDAAHEIASLYERAHKAKG
jgi:hypothetical protein